MLHGDRRKHRVPVLNSSRGLSRGDLFTDLFRVALRAKFDANPFSKNFLTFKAENFLIPYNIFVTVWNRNFFLRLDIFLNIRRRDLKISNVG